MVSLWPLLFLALWFLFTGVSCCTSTCKQTETKTIELRDDVDRVETPAEQLTDPA